MFYGSSKRNEQEILERIYDICFPSDTCIYSQSGGKYYIYIYIYIYINDLFLSSFYIIISNCLTINTLVTFYIQISRTNKSWSVCLQYNLHTKLYLLVIIFKTMTEGNSSQQIVEQKAPDYKTRVTSVFYI
jgi:hypothetical protein